MAEIKPFRGVHYTKEAGNIQDLITQPYDKITPKMQQEYYGKSQYNSVRFVLGKDEPGDDTKNNKYTRANEFFKKFLEEGILVQDTIPTIYAYDQDYIHPDTGDVVTRKCFIAATKLHEYAENIVYPHEHTLSGPKEDRLNLMRAMEANTGLVLMFYRDNENRVKQILEEQTKSEPIFDAVDHYQTHHKLWHITDPKVVSEIQKIIDEKNLIICDGHHRYETALNYRNEMRAKNPDYTGREAWNYRMAAFANMADPALYVFPTHRVIRNVEDFDAKKLLEKLSEKFDIEEIASGCCPPSTAVTLVQKMKQNAEKHAFGFYTKGDDKMYLLTLKSNSVADAIPLDKSNDWKRLDVTILHKLILEPMLGIDDAALAAQTNVDYERMVEDAIEPVTNGTHQCVFLMNPTLTHHVEAVCSHNETMPQKSTDYFPKVQSGLVVQYMPNGDEI